MFAVYKDAMEAQALALMGRKMRAAQTLYGDEVGGAIVPVEEGDFITELAREVLHGAELDDLQSLFADEMRRLELAHGLPDRDQPGTDPRQAQDLAGMGAGTPGSQSGCW